MICFFAHFVFSSSGGWGNVKLKLTTLPRIGRRLVCEFNSIAFAVPRYLAYPLGSRGSGSASCPHRRCFDAC